MPTISNWANSLLSAASSRSPWKTRAVTAGWLSAAVEKSDCAWITHRIAAGRPAGRRAHSTRSFIATDISRKPRVGLRFDLLRKQAAARGGRGA
jgi:hypothetical protein